MQPKTAILIGAGDRGARAYAPYALAYPNELNIIAVAEPNTERRTSLVKEHLIMEENSYDSWEPLLEKEKLADIAIICTLDREHFNPTIKALEQGYHVLLEKPMSPDPKECIEMERVAEQKNRQLTICHVLRYTQFWSKIREIIQKGVIGEVASVQLNENVEVMHMSHSFVRGNWNNKERSSPMILQKSCHDMDIISYILDKKCERVSSYGSLMHFRKENAPKGAPKRCLDGCPVESDCPFHAGRYYLGEGKGWAKKFTEDFSNQGIIKALKETPYGNCVYQSDNNVVDHQVVNMEFAGGATATFSMCGFTREQTRMIQVMGTKGEIRGNMAENSISLFDFLTKHETVIHFSKPVGGHGGGDQAIIRDFLQDMEKHGGKESKSSASVSLRSHLMAFAAEESRLNGGESIHLDSYYARYL
ncbi:MULTISPECIES: Gfo/Idh/MocA family oxidoreductase [Clostridia]|uniref:Gfo/Idh/MocA family protein n=1 Tax=Clostridia TaxID=186801 RepID=UPI000EA15FAD|nr:MULTISPECIES: Gfo/Idh/MocA family oxidoreductase [Clostridia]NBJ68844.1 gfo/Idh/MocA family oxidoreductase [Roseburia sp. 1XD42-34]RKI80222.1 gfo/Idh/MocA family oxidoreductase [Clostridium sp. 1xD42-85]